MHVWPISWLCPFAEATAFGASAFNRSKTFLSCLNRTLNSKFPWCQPMDCYFYIKIKLFIEKQVTTQVRKCQWGTIWHILQEEWFLTVKPDDCWTCPSWWRYQGEEIYCLEWKKEKARGKHSKQ